MENIKDIKIEDISEYFSRFGLEELKRHNITTLEELFKFTENSKTAKQVIREKQYNEIVGTARLLRCKYLGIDPEFNLQDPDITYNLNRIGLSNAAYRSITRSFYRTNFETFEQALNYYQKTINHKNLYYVTKAASYEIEIKTKIILDYYRSKNKSTETNTSNVSKNLDELKQLVELNDELKKLIAERDSIDNQINIILQKIKGTTDKVTK